MDPVSSVLPRAPHRRTPADSLMLAVLGLSGVLSLLLGWQQDQAMLALGGTLVVWALAVGVTLGSPAPVLTRCALAVLGMAMVGLQIQLTRGQVELHFGAFVMLAMLLVYRDWRPIAAGTVAIALHHVGTALAQAAGWGVYCTPQPGLWQVFGHAAYVLVQAGFEGAIALQMARADAAQQRTTQALQENAERLQRAMAEVREASHTIRDAGNEVSSGNRELSDRTEHTAQRLQQVVGSVEQLTRNVTDNAESAEQARDLATGAASVAQRGGNAVREVVGTMEQIAQSSHRIADIIGTIDAIAFQTNLLALNAAVEAARAGEQGRGFSVVAAEVRALAQRSGDAAREIKGLITESVDRVTAGNQLVHQAGQTMDEIVQSVQQLHDTVNQIAGATRAQSAGIAEINGAIGELEGMTQQNAAMVQHSGEVGTRLQGQTERLAQVVAQLGHA